LDLDNFTGIVHGGLADRPESRILRHAIEEQLASVVCQRLLVQSIVNTPIALGDATFSRWHIKGRIARVARPSNSLASDMRLIEYSRQSLWRRFA